ncbi:ATP-dependent RecD-like DNA helicase [Clostridium sp. 'deep sea']|uniref:SF1B family DNA helicase RecD2 n=1 Tax=Clostridium sp. 'deep sea' TaxID=2779445 RepID=UPI0018966EB4|nr:ATP-dependent RecD-like DNA helicase [Clostridium sp. 'deep sea']QOR34260.1 ATP-dependent RecD-like DNA helicase [Clostridium sp. 'deep sea']
MIELTGIVTRFTYRDEAMGYTVAQFEPLNSNEKIKITGQFPVLEVGETITVYGEWFIHPKHGKQLKVNRYKAVIPLNKKGLKSYLASRSFDGIGPKMAEKLVDHFGVEVIEIIKNNPQKLLEVDGLGKSKVDAIIAGMANAENHEAMIFLQGLGLTPGYAGKVIRHYGDETVITIRNNPYILTKDVHGIGFKTADKLARANGLATDHPERLVAGIKYLLQQNSDEGHCYIPLEILNEEASKLLEVAKQKFALPIQTLCLQKDIIIDKKFNNAVYLAPLYYAECGVAKNITRISQWQNLVKSNVTEEINLYEKTQAIKLAKKQKSAVSKALKNGVTVITGGPGTGKTTIVKCIITLFEQLGKQVSLAAPTGRAAQRLGETTGKSAKTIHRLLEYSFDENKGMGFARNAQNPLTTDVLIVDEASMVDTLLMYNLLIAIPPACQLIFVGDVDQLPSVGAGNVLRDIIESKAVEVERLTTIFRQAEKSLIVVNAHRINDGMFPVLTEKDKDFFYVPRAEPEAIVKTIMGLCKKRLPQYGDYHPINDIQVLSPMRRTVTGVDNLNLLLQQALNPHGNSKVSLKRGNMVWREGDKIMQIKNNYRKNVYNGDVGRIIEINNDSKSLHVKYINLRYERVVEYKYEELNQLVLAYAVSIHKSQGSEYPVVIMPVTTQHYLMLQRNLFYTGITRAKKLVVLVGTKKALAIAVKNNKVVERYTALSARLINN